MSAPVRTGVQAGTWTVSDARTRVTFSVRSVGGTARGSVPVGWGDVRIGADGAPLRVRAALDLDGLDTGIARRDRDLRSPRFCDIDRHPTMTFDAHRFTATDDGAWVANGELRVRGTATALEVTGRPEPAGDGWLRVRSSAVLDRRAVGIRAPSLLIGRWVAIEIDAWLRQA